MSTPESPKTPIAVIEMRDARTEHTKPLDVFELQQRRQAVMNALDTEISATAERLMNLVPPELGLLRDEFLANPLGLLSNILQFGHQERKIKEPVVEGFGDVDNDEVLRQLQLLQTAWNGIIVLDITPADPEGQQYVSLYFRAAAKKS